MLRLLVSGLAAVFAGMMGGWTMCGVIPEERRPLDDELAGIGGLDGAGVELAAIVMEPPELHSALAHVMSFSRCVWDRLATRYRYFVLRYRPELSPGRAWA